MDVVTDEISEQVVAEPVQQEGETDLAKTLPVELVSAAPSNDSVQTGGVDLMPEPPVEQTPEQLEPPTPAPKRVRKVRVRAPTEAPSPTPPNPDYWRSRLQEHRGNQRAAKSERYGNLRIM